MSHFKALLFVLFISQSVSAQYGTLIGKITEEDNKTPIPFLRVRIESDGMLLWETTCDTDGNYTIKAIPPGKYMVKFLSFYFTPVHIQDVVIKPDRITFLNINTVPTLKPEYYISREFISPLIEKDATISGETIFMK